MNGEMLCEFIGILEAHASDVKISKIDASDLLDFAIAICDYVYVLRNKFEDFMKRRAIE